MVSGRYVKAVAEELEKDVRLCCVKCSADRKEYQAGSRRIRLVNGI